ncbi:MAG: EFR1 family ferrodoxin [Candidatus Margulisiibacteriota bacterium]|jgi:ferredoxin
MKAILYYFTSTGNSLFAAKELAKLLEKKSISTSVVNIASAINKPIKIESEIVGIIFPVFCWGLPRIVRQFINRLPTTPSFFFAVTTYGGFPGATLKQAERELKTKGITLKFGAAIKMPGNYTPLYGPPSKQKQDKIFEAAKNKIAKIAPLIVHQKSSKIEVSFPLFNWLWSALYNMGSPYFSKADQDFWVTDSCNNCGICEKICPVANITLVEHKPKWHNNCEHCLACLHWCPKEAIQFKKSSLKRARYHQPDMKITDFTH